MTNHSLATIQSLITAYEIKYHRKPNSVKLLAASKSQSSETILQTYTAGQRIFGENYLQEALVKIHALPNDIEWHFIGPIQRNKTRKIAEHFSWVESVESIDIAKRLSDQRPKHLPALNICIEINVSNEATKAGVSIQEAPALVNACLQLPRITLRGLMTIPAPSETFAAQRIPCRALYQLFQSLRDQGIPLDTLSMGMSDDMEAAIAEGATMVRVGRGLFGERGSSRS